MNNILDQFQIPAGKHLVSMRLYLIALDLDMNWNNVAVKIQQHSMDECNNLRTLLYESEVSFYQIKCILKRF